MTAAGEEIGLVLAACEEAEEEQVRSAAEESVVLVTELAAATIVGSERIGKCGMLSCGMLRVGMERGTLRTVGAAACMGVTLPDEDIPPCDEACGYFGGVVVVAGADTGV